MTRVWLDKKRSLEGTLWDFCRRSPVLNCLGCMDQGDEWRALVLFDTQTLIRDGRGQIVRAGPVVAGIRYHKRFLGQAPHPQEIVGILDPPRIFHPNCDDFGAMCLGHPEAGIAMDLILHQVWAGLMFNMDVVQTDFGRYLNRAAAEYVRANAPQFPITRRGLFEAPDEELKNKHWYVPFDPQMHARLDAHEKGVDHDGVEPERS